MVPFFFVILTDAVPDCDLATGQCLNFEFPPGYSGTKGWFISFDTAITTACEKNAKKSAEASGKPRPDRRGDDLLG